MMRPSNSGTATWAATSSDGMSPLDVATQVAVPEFDGRIITVPFSFKEIDDEGLITYSADPERCARVAGLAVRHARLRHVPAAEKQVALVFSAYPTKHARIGNAVGLDTPASAVALLRAMREHGIDIGEVPGVDAEDGDALIHALIERGDRTPTGSPRKRWRATRSGYRRPTTAVGSPRCPPGWPTPWWRTGARRQVSCSSTAAATPTVRSSSRG